MSLERRKPFAPLHTSANSVLAPHSAPPHPTISRPRRQMQQYHYHPHQHKRYATVLPRSSRSSATSSAESVYSTANSLPPRQRKLSAAEDVAARVRARWAALEALERTSSAPGPVANPADTISATKNSNTAAAAAATATWNTAARSGARNRVDSNAAPEWRQHNWAGLEARERDHALLLEMGKEREREKENERSMSMAMQVDGHEKPLPPRPAPLALALHLNPGQGPLSAPAHMPTAPTMAMGMTPMAVDTHENGSTPREDGNAGAGAGAGGGETSDSTLRMTPTSLTCYETTESQRQVLQRRPTRALTPPQVRRRPSITDELEEAVRSPT